MSKNNNAQKSDARTETGWSLPASYTTTTYDLVSLSPAVKADLQAEFPKLKDAEPTTSWNDRSQALRTGTEVGPAGGAP